MEKQECSNVQRAKKEELADRLRETFVAFVVASSEWDRAFRDYQRGDTSDAEVKRLETIAGNASSEHLGAIEAVRS